MKHTWKQIVKVGVLTALLSVVLFSSVGTVFAKWTKEECDVYRLRNPEGGEIGADITYDFQCGWMKGATGGVPTGSLTLPEEHAEKYDQGIVARDPETGEILGLIGLIIRLTNWALGFVGVVALVAFIYGGYIMVANFGNEDSMGKGKKILAGSAVGIIVILLSFTAVNALLRAGGGRPGAGSTDGATGVQVDYVEATLDTLENTLFEIINNIGDIGDLCPGTSYTQKASVVGCASGEYPADSDGDKVINLFDLDDDNDGTPDKDDNDDDGDGVLDTEDFCPETLLFSVARPWQYPPYKDQIEDGILTQDQIRTGFDDTPPYVRPGTSTYPGSENDSRSVGCALYEGAWDSDTDGYSNGIPGGPEEAECTPDNAYIDNIDCDDDNDGVLDKDDSDNDGDGVPDAPSILQAVPGSSTPQIVVIDSQFPSLMNQFEREVLIACSRLPQTSQVNNLCDDTNGKLILAISNFSANPDEIAIRNLLELITSLRAIVNSTPKVQASLVVIPSNEGSAPFITAFSGSSSVDPSAVSIPNENFEWCIGYTSVADSLRCPSSKKKIGSNVTHVFDEPGVYAVSLRVVTADTDTNGIKSAMDGYSTITIVVNPPNSNIRMKISSGDISVDVTDKRKYQVLFSSNITNGITFDVSESRDYAGETTHILKTAWDFGDGNVEEFDGFATQQTHTYMNAGVYNVVFEIRDDRYQQSRKVLELDVTDIVADLEILPDSRKGDVTTQFTFDASGSRVEGGQIGSYFWEVVDTTEEDNWLLIDSTETNRELIGPVVNYVFPRVGTYEVKLTVSTTSGDKRRTSSSDVQILSRKPAARFNWRVSDNRKPATVFFDASGSSDPDPNTLLNFEWTIDGEAVSLIGNDKVPMMGNYTFDSVGEHRVDLVVADNTGITDKISHVVKIDSTLDVDFTADRFSAYPEQEITFTAQSATAAGYFWDFGDGVKKYSETAIYRHSYPKTGTYTITLTVDNLSGEENAISKRVRIGDKDAPVAAVRVLINGLEIEPEERLCGSGEGVLADRLSTLTFDGSAAVNTDGTSRGLKYTWDFDDGQKASSRSTVHKFEEITVGSDCYKVTLTVTDRTTGKSDTSLPISVRVENIRPIIIALDIIEPTEKVTPISVPINLVGSKDPDGRILDYTWWYYDAQVPGKKIDVHVTTEPKTVFTIGPRAKEGIESKYYFAVEVRDNDGGKILTEDILGKSQALLVTNGPSLAPLVEFTVDQSRIKVGEKITFKSTSKDPLGRYIPTTNYKWDFYGDGRYDREIVGPQVEFTYDRPGTFLPKLKVISDGISEIFEMEVIVEAVTEKPEAAFLFMKSGNKVTFISNSTVDSQLQKTDLRHAWDFDTLIDTDGNGNKNDDVDSAQPNPTYIYDLDTERDIEVRLVVTDIMEQTDDVVRKVITVRKEDIGALGASVQKKLRAVLETEPAADSLDKKIYLKSSERKVLFIMKRSTGKIKAYKLDLNTQRDSDGDGVSDNDIDNALHASLDDGSPFAHTYSAEDGNPRAKLTVEDFQGNTDSVSIDIILNESGKSPFEENFSADGVFVLADMAPIAIFSVKAEELIVGKSATFDASDSSFPEEKIKEYRWDFNGDGDIDIASGEPTTQYVFSDDGSYEVMIGIFSESGLYAEYAETVIVRDVFNPPVADFSFEISDLSVTFTNLSSFDTSFPGNVLNYEWKFIPLDEEGKEVSTSGETVDSLVLSEEQSDKLIRVTGEVTPYQGQITRPVVLTSDAFDLVLEKGTSLVDENDREFTKSLAVPKSISAPKGSLDAEKKLVDAFLVVSVKPVTFTKNAVATLRLNGYNGLSESEIFYFNLSTKSWESVSSTGDDDTLSFSITRAGIYGLAVSKDSAVTKISSEAKALSGQKFVQTSTIESPVVVFDDYGTYNVVLNVVDSAERKDTKLRLLALTPGAAAVVTSPQVTEEILISEEVVPEQPEIIEEEVIASEEVVPVTEPVAEESSGGFGWLFIVVVIVFVFGVIVAVFFILNKIKEQMAHSEGLMAGGVPGVAPQASPAPSTPAVEVVVEKKPVVPEKPEVPAPSAPSVKEEQKPADVSQPKDTEKKSPSGDAEGPIPDWLKKK